MVAKLMAAGAIPVGKTNLDQFVSGLAGTRSPYGACSSVFDERYISGGSSSGSAVAVAAGLVSFALGTDVEGSGSVAAAFNGIVGVKPSRGALSTAATVPVCRSLDCISIFTLNCADAAIVFECARGYDASDCFSCRAGQPRAWSLSRFRFGMPRLEMLHFFGEGSAQAVLEEAAACLGNLGGTRIEIAFETFRDAAQLFQAGPWAAERHGGDSQFFKGACGISSSSCCSIPARGGRDHGRRRVEAFHRLSRDLSGGRQRMGTDRFHVAAHRR